MVDDRKKFRKDECQNLDCAEAQVQSMGMAEFCCQYKSGLAYSSLSLDPAAIVLWPALHTLVAAANTLLCLVTPGLEDSKSR